MWLLELCAWAVNVFSTSISVTVFLNPTIHRLHLSNLFNSHLLCHLLTLLSKCLCARNWKYQPGNINQEISTSTSIGIKDNVQKQSAKCHSRQKHKNVMVFKHDKKELKSVQKNTVGDYDYACIY